MGGCQPTVFPNIITDSSIENAKFLTDHNDQKKEIEDITNSALNEED